MQVMPHDETSGDFAVDAFTQKRVLKLRDEIASLHHENELHRSRCHHTLEEKHANDLRRFRLLLIREELRGLLQPIVRERSLE